MGLIGKLFGGNKDGAPSSSSPLSSTPPLSAQFQESEMRPPGQPSRNARRRELVQVVLRETMRQHGIPSDWIDCRVLSVMSGTSALNGAPASAGAHVTFIVRGGEDRLLTYVHAFQHSFVLKMREFDPRATDWILSLSWQFSGQAPAGRGSMPDPDVWQPAAAAPAPVPAPAQASAEDEELQQDLKALFAIRDAVLQQTAEPAAAGDFVPTQPGETLAAARKPTGR